ncbi:MAG: translocation/assembly module TamB domain-containing protein [Clostridiales bacterium]|nr:translocation/assembly module TamB domain-containing protein [Clostridiales bacterium]
MTEKEKAVLALKNREYDGTPPHMEIDIQIWEDAIRRPFRDHKYFHKYPEKQQDDCEIETYTEDILLLARRFNTCMVQCIHSVPDMPFTRQKDVLSLLMFGVTSKTRGEQDIDYQSQLGSELATQQIAHILQRPISKFTRLDIFRLEATPSQIGDERVQKLNVGKKINDRLSVEFASELKQEDAIQSFILEYWLTDFFIFKGARGSDASYQMGAGFKFKSR